MFFFYHHQRPLFWRNWGVAKMGWRVLFVKTGGVAKKGVEKKFLNRWGWRKNGKRFEQNAIKIIKVGTSELPNKCNLFMGKSGKNVK